MQTKLVEGRLFDFGPLFITANAQEQLPLPEVQQALLRHFSGDWGDLEEEDRQANQEALTDGSRLFSAYHTAAGTKFWIITDAVIDEAGHRQATTVLLPEDY